jgi:hypothetical protein
MDNDNDKDIRRIHFESVKHRPSCDTPASREFSWALTIDLRRVTCCWCLAILGAAAEASGAVDAARP